MSSIRNKWGVSLLVLAFSVSANNVLAQTCVPHPTCAELGYDKKESDCGKNATVRCPFNKAEVFCTAYTDKEGTTLPKAGDILFSDKTWGPELRTDKRAIGVIVDGSGLAINLHSINLPWGGSGSGANSQLSLGTDGKYNTSKIIEYFTSKGFTGDYAAKYCKGYTTTQTNPGDWYLPSEYEADVILRNIGAINKGLINAKGIAFAEVIKSVCVQGGMDSINCSSTLRYLSNALITSNQYSSGYALCKKYELQPMRYSCPCSSYDNCRDSATIEKCRNEFLQTDLVGISDITSEKEFYYTSYPTRCVFQFK